VELVVSLDLLAEGFVTGDQEWCWDVTGVGTGCVSSFEVRVPLEDSCGRVGICAGFTRNQGRLGTLLSNFLILNFSYRLVLIS